MFYSNFVLWNINKSLIFLFLKKIHIMMIKNYILRIKLVDKEEEREKEKKRGI